MINTRLANFGGSAGESSSDSSTTPSASTSPEAFNRFNTQFDKLSVDGYDSVTQQQFYQNNNNNNGVQQQQHKQILSSKMFSSKDELTRQKMAASAVKFPGIFAQQQNANNFFVSNFCQPQSQNTQPQLFIQQNGPAIPQLSDAALFKQPEANASFLTLLQQQQQQLQLQQKLLIQQQHHQQQLFVDSQQSQQQAFRRASYHHPIQQITSPTAVVANSLLNANSSLSTSPTVVHSQFSTSPTQAQLSPQLLSPLLFGATAAGNTPTNNNNAMLPGILLPANPLLSPDIYEPFTEQSSRKRGHPKSDISSSSSGLHTPPTSIPSIQPHTPIELPTIIESKQAEAKLANTVAGIYLQKLTSERLNQFFSNSMANFGGLAAANVAAGGGGAFYMPTAPTVTSSSATAPFAMPAVAPQSIHSLHSAFSANLNGTNSETANEGAVAAAAAVARQFMRQKSADLMQEARIQRSPHYENGHNRCSGDTVASVSPDNCANNYEITGEKSKTYRRNHGTAPKFRKKICVPENETLNFSIKHESQMDEKINNSTLFKNEPNKASSLVSSHMTILANNNHQHNASLHSSHIVPNTGDIKQIPVHGQIQNSTITASQCFPQHVTQFPKLTQVAMNLVPITNVVNGTQLISPNNEQEHLKLQTQKQIQEFQYQQQQREQDKLEYQQKKQTRQKSRQQKLLTPQQYIQLQEQQILNAENEENDVINAENDAGEPESTVTRCEWNGCGCDFPVLKDLVDHIHEEHINKQDTFHCHWNGCERVDAFTAPYMLTLHVRRHTGEKPHLCKRPNCNKRYSRLENLKTHIRSHNNEKPYKCAICEKAFSNASDRAKHQSRTHSDVKHYACPVDQCGKRYSDPSSLRKHIINTHGEQTYAIAKQNKARNGRRGSYGRISPSVTIDGGTASAANVNATSCIRNASSTTSGSSTARQRKTSTSAKDKTAQYDNEIADYGGYESGLEDNYIIPTAHLYTHKENSISPFIDVEKITPPIESANKYGQIIANGNNNAVGYANNNYMVSSSVQKSCCDQVMVDKINVNKLKENVSVKRIQNESQTKQNSRNNKNIKNNDNDIEKTFTNSGFTSLDRVNRVNDDQIRQFNAINNEAYHINGSFDEKCIVDYNIKMTKLKVENS